MARVVGYAPSGRRFLRNANPNPTSLCSLYCLGSNSPILSHQKTPLLGSFFDGSGGRIRTHVLSESESDALPLGDTRIYNSGDKTLSPLFILQYRIKKAILLSSIIWILRCIPTCWPATIIWICWCCWSRWCSWSFRSCWF